VSNASSRIGVLILLTLVAATPSCSVPEQPGGREVPPQGHDAAHAISGADIAAARAAYRKHRWRQAAAGRKLLRRERA